MKTVMLKRAKKLRRFVDLTTSGEKFYAVGALLGLWACVLWLFTEKYAIFTALFALLIFICGLVWESLSLVMKLWENKYSKIIISLFIAAGSTFTIAFSSSIVADIVGTDPSKFQYTTALVSLLLVPFNTWLGLLALAVISTVLMFAIIPFAWMYDQTIRSVVFRYACRLKRKPRKEKYFWLMLLVRGLAIGFLFGSIQAWGMIHKSYGEFIYDSAEKFIYRLELYPKSHCTKLHSLERFGYINAKKVVVGNLTANGYTFTVRDCELKKH